MNNMNAQALHCKRNNLTAYLAFHGHNKTKRRPWSWCQQRFRGVSTQHKRINLWWLYQQESRKRQETQVNFSFSVLNYTYQLFYSRNLQVNYFYEKMSLLFLQQWNNPCIIMTKTTWMDVFLFQLDKRRK